MPKRLSAFAREAKAHEGCRATIQRQRGVIRRSLRRMVDAKVKKAEMVEAVYRGAYDAASALELNPVPKPAPDRRRQGSPEVAVPILADFQLAKVTPEYNSEVCEQRIELLADKVINLTRFHRSATPVRECRVWMLGDIIEGELIFPGQEFLIDASLYEQVCVTGPHIVGNFLRRMLAEFERVHVVGVIGNHGALGGRARRNYHPETNADRMLLRIVASLFESAGEKRITFEIPDGGAERNWYAIDDVGGYRAMLFHGDQVRGHAGIPWYGFDRKVAKWNMGLRDALRIIPGGFDDAYCGHFHQHAHFPIGGPTTVRISGSPESFNTYAQEQLASMGRPSQRLLFVRPGLDERGIPYGVTSEYQVWLDD